ncbi:MAG TPA: hypothetical protein VJP07_04240 [Dehalococcoidia bacterium]|nr:hypothetical protein [Dehalococcoidia bacterium]
MSLQTLRFINRVAQTIVFLCVLFAVIWLVSLTGTLDSSLTVSLVMVGLLAAIVVWLFARAIRQRYRNVGQVRKQPGKSGFGVLTRVYHATDPIERTVAAATLSRIIGLEAVGELVGAERCRDCGHEEFLVKTRGGDIVGITLNFDPRTAKTWIFGLFGVWSRVGPMIVAETAAPDEPAAS